MRSARRWSCNRVQKRLRTGDRRLLVGGERDAKNFLVNLLITPDGDGGDPGSIESYPRGEFFGGYSYFHAPNGGGSFNGVDTSIAQNLRPWFGGALEISSHWNGPNVSTFMYGPVFSFRQDPRVTPFVHFLAGGVRGSVGYLDISHSKTTFGFAAGGGVDVQVTKNLAVRMVQVDYIMSRF